MNVALRHCLEADKEHGENRRQYAHTFHYPQTICLADAFWSLPKKHRDGIILHELGHLLAGVEASEDAANEAVEDSTGARIEYVNSRWGPNLERAGGDVRPFMSWNSISGRGSAGLPVAVPNPRTFTGHHYETQYRIVRKDSRGFTTVLARAVDEEDATSKARELSARGVRGPFTLQYQDLTLPLTPKWHDLYGSEGPRRRIEKNVTDRALRYRANEQAPEGPKVCCYCGSVRFVEIDHINGFEEDTSPENLAWACRRCNTLKGVAFANSGRGRRTAQYNPTKSGGAATIGEWVRAVACVIPHKGAKYSGENYGLACQMSVSQAVEMVRATPQWRRQEYGSLLQSRKRARGRAEEVPF